MSTDFDKVVLSAADRQEIANNKKGKLILLIGIVLIVIGCALSAGWLAPFAIFAFIWGFLITMTNKTEYQIRQEKALANAKANLMIAQVKAGQKINLDDTSYSREAKQKEETQKIVKGAVIGGVVAGPAGAVVGATVAKNKIDNEKK